MIKIKDAYGNVVNLPTIKGMNGKSAYQYAIEAGFIGTEDEFTELIATTTATVKNHLEDSTAHTDIRESVQNLEDQLNALTDGEGGGIAGNAATATKLQTARKINGVEFDGSKDIILTPSDIGADESGAADTALENAKSYTDTKVADLVGSAPETLDTLEELSNALKDNADIVDVLNESITSKASSSDLVAHTEDTSMHVPSGGSEGQLLKRNADGTAEWASVSATSAEQDSAGNVIVDTYATKSEIISNNDTTIDITINAVGWYRIACWKGESSAYAMGAICNSCDIIFKKNWNDSNNEYHKISLASIYKKSNFVSKLSKSNTQEITKIRHVVDTNNKVAYIEFYYNSTKSNTLAVTLNNAVTRGRRWGLITPELTEETVDGVIVYSSLNIPANSSGTATYDSTGNNIAETTLKADLSTHNVPLTDGNYGDFNNYLDIGIYVFGANSGMSNTSNAPTNKAGTLIVTDYTGGSKSMSGVYAYRVQEFYTHDNSGVFKRNIQTGSVSELIVGEWVEVIQGNSTVITNITNHMNNKKKPHACMLYDNGTYNRKLIGLIKINTWDYCGGTIEMHRVNGAVPNSKIEFTMQKKYNDTSSFYCNFKAQGFYEIEPVLFTYNGELYAGFYYFNSAAQQENIICDTYSYSNMSPFLVQVQNTSDNSILNEEVYSSLKTNCYSTNNIKATGKWDVHVTKSDKDSNDNKIVDTYLKKSGDVVNGTIYPNTNNSYSLGRYSSTSSNYWAGVYASKFYLNGTQSTPVLSFDSSTTTTMYNSADNTASGTYGVKLTAPTGQNMYISGSRIYLNGSTSVSANTFTHSDPSIKAFTEDIVDDDEKLSLLVERIMIRSYHLKESASNEITFGINAEELEELCLELGIDVRKYAFLNISYNHMLPSTNLEDSKFYPKFRNISYDDLFTLVIGEFQKLKNKYSSLEDRLTILENKLS